MGKTLSEMTEIGKTAPDFELTDTVSGKKMTLKKLKSPTATVIMFICNHCPYVKHVQKELVTLARDYQPKGISFIAISSNDAAQYPEDAPEKMREVARQMRYPFPYLYDESQQVAKAYHAVCTPEFYIYDAHLKCVYQGRLDDSMPESKIPVTGTDVRKALNCILTDNPVDEHQIPSMGCNIKWKTGQEHDRRLRAA
jgi:peroxiredoxin